MRCLLVIDPGGRVVLGDVDSGVRVQVGGERPAPPQARRSQARTAVWSPAGQWTAWSLDSQELDGVREVCLHDEGSDTTRVIASELTAFYLSPSPCGRYLSHLSPGPLGLELAVSDVRTGELRIIERGQPLFWSWSPDSSRIAIHVEQRVLVAPADGGAVQLLSDRAGSFVAPWWMPDGSVVFVVDDEIICHGPDGSVTTLAAAGTGRFALDPDGRRLAFIDVVEDQPCLVVTDLLTGERDVVTTERTAAFFWSPQGLRLAALVQAGPSQLQWIVFDGEGVARLAPFRPGGGWLRDVLPFFEQYAQSHAVWSDDGTQLVAAGLDANGSTEAVVQSVASPTSTETLPGARLAWWAAE